MLGFSFRLLGAAIRLADHSAFAQIQAIHMPEKNLFNFNRLKLLFGRPTCETHGPANSVGIPAVVCRGIAARWIANYVFN
jgi:hypothetical protein